MFKKVRIGKSYQTLEMETGSITNLPNSKLIKFEEKLAGSYLTVRKFVALFQARAS